MTADTELVEARELRPGDRLPYFTCDCPCYDGPCPHDAEVWTVEAVGLLAPRDGWCECPGICGHGDRAITFTNGRSERLYALAMLVRERPETLPPDCTPAECDHDGAEPCSRCCPCDECGRIRAADRP